MPRNRLQPYKIIGYTPQAVAFQEWRTVEHALATLGKLSGLGKTKLESRIPEVLRQFGLEDIRRKIIIRLSGRNYSKELLRGCRLRTRKSSEATTSNPSYRKHHFNRPRDSDNGNSLLVQPGNCHVFATTEKSRMNS